jgi:hypothetical protein
MLIQLNLETAPNNWKCVVNVSTEAEDIGEDTSDCEDFVLAARKCSMGGLVIAF